MMRLKLDTEQIQMIALFEKITRARVKESLEFKERTIFIVEFGDLRKALGRENSNVTKIEGLLNRKIKIVEFNPDPLVFIRNIFAPLRMLGITEDNGLVVIKGTDAKTKGLMIGAKAQNLRMYESIVKRHFPSIQEIKVV